MLLLRVLRGKERGGSMLEEKIAAAVATLTDDEARYLLEVLEDAIAGRCDLSERLGRPQAQLSGAHRARPSAP